MGSAECICRRFEGSDQKAVRLVAAPPHAYAIVMLLTHTRHDKSPAGSAARPSARLCRSCRRENAGVTLGGRLPASILQSSLCARAHPRPQRRLLVDTE